MKNVGWMMFNILKVSFRKRSTIITFFVLPVLGMLLSIAAYHSQNSAPWKIGMLDQDQTRLSRDLIHSLREGHRFIIMGIQSKEIKKKLIAGEVDGVVMLPAGFAASIRRGGVPETRLVSLKGQAGTGWFKNYLNAMVQNLLDIKAAAGDSQALFEQIYERYRRDRLSVQVVKVRDQRGDKGVSGQSIGFLILFIMMGVGNSMEMILREKRNRTYYRICAAPVTSGTYILANVLANLCIVVVQILLALFMMTKVLGMETFIPLGWLFLILVSLGLTAIGLGLMIVAFSQDTAQATVLQNLIITPTCLLAGCFWPGEVMSRVIQRMAKFLPQHWAMDAMHRLQQGGGFGQVRMHVAIILGFALVFFLVAAYRLGRNEGVKTFV